MSIHREMCEVEWHDEPLDPETTASGRHPEWRGRCDCGWIGPWRCSSESAQVAKTDYREHVEERLGPAAYIDAEVRCTNCGFDGTQAILVGMHVMSNACLRCGQRMLRPNNDAWNDSKAEREGWRFF